MEEGERLMRGWRHSRLVTSDIGFILDFPPRARRESGDVFDFSSSRKKKRQPMLN